MSDLTVKTVKILWSLAQKEVSECDKLADSARKGDTLEDLGFGIEIV